MRAGYYLRNYGMILLFGGAMLLMGRCLQQFENRWTSFFVNGFLSVGISAGICLMVMLCNRDVRARLIRRGKRYEK